MSEAGQQQDIAALAKGGRTNVAGFLIRLLARIPFLIIASRMYGAEAMGRFASALVMVEFAAQLCTLGQKRGLAARLTADDQHPANAVADAMLLNALLALLATALIWAFPLTMYPKGNFTMAEHLLVLAILPSGLTDIALSALAYRFDVATSVRARAVAEPWALSIAAGLLYFTDPKGGLSLAYLASMFAAWIVAMVPLLRAYGLPRAWRPHPIHLWRLGAANMPLALADMVEWGTRKLDVFVLRFFVGEAPLGVYYFAQQFASLPQKLKTSFEPVLGPVITRNVQDRNYAAIARQVCQVGFWIVVAQLGIALALGVAGEGLMGLGGPGFVGGTAALVFLLLAEVVASTAVVSEAALVYLARYQNLVLSLVTIALQAVLTVGRHPAGQPSRLWPAIPGCRRCRRADAGAGLCLIRQGAAAGAHSGPSDQQLALVSAVGTAACRGIWHHRNPDPAGMGGDDRRHIRHARGLLVVHLAQRLCCGRSLAVQQERLIVWFEIQLPEFLTPHPAVRLNIDSTRVQHVQSRFSAAGAISDARNNREGTDAMRITNTISACCIMALVAGCATTSRRATGGRTSRLSSPRSVRAKLAVPTPMHRLRLLPRRRPFHPASWRRRTPWWARWPMRARRGWNTATFPR